jgi:hypothetical protein
MLEEGDEVAQRTGRQTAGGGRRARGGRQVEEAGVQDVVVWVGALTFPCNSLARRTPDAVRVVMALAARR